MGAWAAGAAEGLARLKDFLKVRSLTAGVTLFWHGAAAAAIPDAFKQVLAEVPVSVETDFDRDEDLGNSRPLRVA